MPEKGLMTRAMLDAIYAVHPRICRELGIDGFRARKMLRIEISDEAYMQLRHENGPFGDVAWAVFGSGTAADAIHGVSIYWVRGLPEPGWRLINPLEHDRIRSPEVQTPAERRFTDPRT